MRDETRSPSPDFSQESRPYKNQEVSEVMINGEPLKKPIQGVTTQPSGLFSSRPMGTFTNSKKPEKASYNFDTLRNPLVGGSEMRSKTSPEILKFQETIRALSSRFSESKATKEFLFTLARESGMDADWEDRNIAEDRFSSMAKKLEESFARISSFSEGDLMTLEKDIVTFETRLGDLKQMITEIAQEKRIEAENLKRLQPLINTYFALKVRDEALPYEKINTDKKIKIEGLLSDLSWLDTNPSEGGNGDDFETVEYNLKIVESLIKEQEEFLAEQKITQEAEEAEIKKQEVGDSNKKELELIVLRKLTFLSRRFGELLAKTEILLHSTKDEAYANLLRAHKDELTALEATLLGDTPTQELLDTFVQKLSEYKNFLEEERVQENTQETITDSLDPWSGWPSVIKLESKQGDTKRGIQASSHWILLDREGDFKKSLSDPHRWATLRTNFDKEFDLYTHFLNGGDTSKKIKSFPDLIKAKNDIVKALLELDTDKALSLINALRTTRELSEQSWKELISKEAEAKTKESKEKEDKAPLFLELKTKEAILEDLISRFGSIAPLITSNQERSALEKIQQSLKEELQTLKNNPTQASIDAFGEKLLTYTSNLEKKERTTLGLYGKAILRSPQNLSTLPRKIILKQKKEEDKSIEERMITPEEWANKQREKYGKEKDNDLAKSKASLELEAEHTNMIEKNPQKYLDTYSTKEWLPNEIGKEISNRVLKNYLEKIKAERETLRREFDARMSGTSTEGKEKMTKDEINSLTNKITFLDTTIDAIEQIPFKNKLESYRVQAKEKTLLRTRQVYSPLQDTSIADISVEGKTLTSKEKSLATKARTNRLLRASKEGKDELTTQEAVKAYTPPSALLTDKVTPNHYEGMTNSLTEEEASETENAYEAKEPHALPNSIEGNTSNAQEQKKQKHDMVNKLLNVVLQNRLQTFGNKWKAFAVATVVGIGAGIGVAVALDEKEFTPTTLEQRMPWRNYLQTDDSKKFLNDFMGDKKRFLSDLIGDGSLTFSSFIKKYAPSAHVDDNNLSTIKHISDMRCETLFTEPGPVYGINENQRKELCALISNLQAVIQATEANDQMVKGQVNLNFKQNAFAFGDSTITIHKFYEIVKAAAAKADERERVK